MQKEMISMRQATAILAAFIIGSSIVIGGNSDVGQDSWATLLISFVITVPVYLIYARVMKLYPEMDLFEIIETVLGKVAGKVIILLMSWYALHLCAIVLQNFSQYTQIVIMHETPQLPLAVLMLLVCLYLATSGVETIGKWALATLAIIMTMLVITTIISINHMDLTHIQPVLGHSASELMSASFKLFTFPMAEAVLFLGVAGAVKKKDSPFKLYMLAPLIGMGALFLITLRNIAVLGAPMLEAKYFPSYAAVRIITIGDYITRIEGTISTNFMLSGLTRISLCLLVAGKGIAKLFNITSYRRILPAVALLALALGAILYPNAMEMFSFINFYQYYALPFELLFPVIIWLAAEIRIRRNKHIKATLHAAE